MVPSLTHPRIPGRKWRGRTVGLFHSCPRPPLGPWCQPRPVFRGVWVTDSALSLVLPSVICPPPVHFSTPLAFFKNPAWRAPETALGNRKQHTDDRCQPDTPACLGCLSPPLCWRLAPLERRRGTPPTLPNLVGSTVPNCACAERFPFWSPRCPLYLPPVLRGVGVRIF